MLVPKPELVKSGTPFAANQEVSFATASVESLSAWHASASTIFAVRNREYAIMRRVFNGNYVSNQGGAALAQGELNDSHKLTYNMINTAVRRSMDECSAPIEVSGVPRGVEPDDIQAAEDRQKLLMDWLRSEKAQLKFIMAAFYQALLGKAILHVRPDESKPYKLSLDLIVPEYFYPIPKTGHWFDYDGVIVAQPKFRMGDPRSADADGRNIQSGETCDDLEFWSNDGVVRVEGGVEKFRRAHKWGRTPFSIVHNIALPHQDRGQGDGDQAVGLNEYLNQLLSDQADVLGYLANPIIVVRGNKQGTGSLIFAPRAIWELEREGSAEILSWVGSPPSFETQILRVMQGIEDSTGHSAPSFGREVPSGVSGEAIRSILAGFNTRMGAKQTYLGIAIAEICETAQMIWEKEFPGEKFEVSGEGNEPGRGRTIQPKDFKGWHRVQVIFQPQNETVRVFTELEKKRNGVQSRLTTMRRLGIPNPAEEEKRILIEQVLDAKIAQMMQGAAPGMGWMDQDPAAGGMPMAGRGAAPGRQPMRSSNVGDLAKRLQSANPGTLADMLGVPEAASLGRAGANSEVDIRDFQDAVDGLQVSGRVFLEGDVVSEGRTSGPVTVRVENEADIPQVQEALGSLAGRARFVTAKEEQTGAPRLSLLRPGR